MMKFFTLTTSLFVAASSVAWAGDKLPVYQGCYEVRSGQIETLATSLFTAENPALRQQGTFSARLKRAPGEKPDSVSRKIRIRSGVVVGEGEVTAAGLNVRHTLSNGRRSGVIVAEIGQIVAAEPSASDPACVLEVTELLGDFSGYGVYSNLDTASALFVSGEIDNCTGKNTFDEMEGQLCFW